MKKWRKHQLFPLVQEKIKSITHYFHIISVVNILIDEIIQELKAGKEVEIGGLGTIKLFSYPAKIGHNVLTGKYQKLKGTKRLRFVIDKKLLKYLKEDK